MTQAEPKRHGSLFGYLCYIYQIKYWWVQLFLLGLSLALAHYSANSWWGFIALVIAHYVFYVAFGLYVSAGWIMLRRPDRLPLLASVTFITVCCAVSITLAVVATPGPLRSYWWLGLVWPIVGWPGLFGLFKLCHSVGAARVSAITRSRDA